MPPNLLSQSVYFARNVQMRRAGPTGVTVIGYGVYILPSTVVKENRYRKELLTISNSQKRFNCLAEYSVALAEEKIPKAENRNPKVTM